MGGNPKLLEGVCQRHIKYWWKGSALHKFRKFDLGQKHVRFRWHWSVAVVLTCCSSFNPNFVKMARDNYGADVKQLSSDNQQAKDEVNQWVASRTANLIPQIVGNVTDDLRMIIVSALYIKVRLSKQELTELTKIDLTGPLVPQIPRYDDNKETILRRQWNQRCGYDAWQPQVYLRWKWQTSSANQRIALIHVLPTIQAIQLPLGPSGKQFCATVVLPKTGHTIADTVLTYDGQDVVKSLEFASHVVDLSMPKFTATFSVELKVGSFSYLMQLFFFSTKLGTSRR